MAPFPHGALPDVACVVGWATKGSQDAESLICSLMVHFSPSILCLVSRYYGAPVAGASGMGYAPAASMRYAPAASMRYAPRTYAPGMY